MDKWEIILLGIVSIAALVFMLFYANNITGKTTEAVYVYEPFNMGLMFETTPATSYPSLNSIKIMQMTYDKDELPPRQSLIPKIMGFQVDKISIPEMNFYNYLSLKKDKIHTFSGIAGYYPKDPTKFIQAQLCTYSYKIKGAPLYCEIVPLIYSNNKIIFAKGYSPGEYIAGQAAGTDFGALFILANPDYGILAASPIAYLRWQK